MLSICVLKGESVFALTSKRQRYGALVTEGARNAFGMCYPCESFSIETSRVAYMCGYHGHKCISQTRVTRLYTLQTVHDYYIYSFIHHKHVIAKIEKKNRNLTKLNKIRIVTTIHSPYSLFSNMTICKEACLQVATQQFGTLHFTNKFWRLFRAYGQSAAITNCKDSAISSVSPVIAYRKCASGCSNVLNGHDFHIILKQRFLTHGDYHWFLHGAVALLLWTISSMGCLLQQQLSLLWCLRRILRNDGIAASYKPILLYLTKTHAHMYLFRCIIYVQLYR